MNNKATGWLLFAALSFIWGSSFILMKGGLLHLSAYQVASIRIISSGLVLLPIAVMSFRQIPVKKLPVVFLSGLLGSLLPAYLFCLAEKEISSSLAGTLNSLTPIFAIVSGALFFKAVTPAHKVWGIALAFTGSILLFFAQPGFGETGNLLAVCFVVLATVFYGYNVNMVHRHLGNIGSLKVVAVALGLNAIPAAVVLFFTGYFNRDLFERGNLVSTGYATILGVFGTALATVLFYVLIKRSGAVFAAMVTYGIPAVAIFWGVVFGEHVGIKQIACVVIILSGVWLANRKPKEVQKVDVSTP